MCLVCSVRLERVCVLVLCVKMHVHSLNSLAQFTRSIHSLNSLVLLFKPAEWAPVSAISRDCGCAVVHSSSYSVGPDIGGGGDVMVAVM